MGKSNLETYAVEASRLVGSGGDIRESYSADTIVMGNRIRKPFKWQDRLFVATSFSPGSEAEAYALISLPVFDGTPTTYQQKTGTDEGAELARNDPNGFYHGMAVKTGKETVILCGPPVRFVVLEDAPATPQQMTLFVD